MNEIQLSYVIPAFNAGKTIEICVESIKSSMSLSPEIAYEIIVVDNNSTDDTPEILPKLNVTIIVEKKQGRSFARNTGLKRARGKFIAFIDADVYLKLNWAKNLLELFKKENVGGVQGRIIPCKEYGSKSLNEYRFWSIGLDTNLSFCLPQVKANESPMINSAACLYLKKALIEVGGFNILLERHEDIDLAKRVFLSGYNLASSLTAEAMVIFHGNGWWDYFKRSFADGFYKNKYSYSWSNFYIKHKTSSLRMFFNQSKFYVNKAFEEEQIFWFVKIGLLIFNSLGRACGLIWYRLNRDHFKNLKTHNLQTKQTAQFIFFDEGHYQINLDTNELLDYSLVNPVDM